MTDARQALFDMLEAAVEAQVFPGGVALVWRDGTVLYHEAHGVLATHPWTAPWHRPAERDSVYDLASLTKVLSTTMLVAMALGQGKVRLEDPVPEPWAAACPGATLCDLLEHAAGLAAHREYFATISPFDPAAVVRAVCGTPPVRGPRVRAEYSDLGFIILGAWLERIWGRPLADLFEDRIAYPLGLRGGVVPALGYRDLARSVDALERGLDRIAPTEVYDPALHHGDPPSHFAVRRDERYAHGRVHDDNCFVMGGVAGHAGLFGSAQGVLEVAIAWSRCALPGWSESLRDRFAQPSQVEGSSRRLGFDGLDVRPTAVGHTGYTGTSLMIDHRAPEGPLVGILLSNRVHPTRNGTGIADVRRRFHALAGRL